MGSFGLVAQMGAVLEEAGAVKADVLGEAEAEIAEVVCGWSSGRRAGAGAGWRRSIRSCGSCRRRARRRRSWCQWRRWGLGAIFAAGEGHALAGEEGAERAGVEVEVVAEEGEGGALAWFPEEGGGRCRPGCPGRNWTWVPAWRMRPLTR